MEGRFFCDALKRASRTASQRKLGKVQNSRDEFGLVVELVQRAD
jgi:hypothetical protein